MPRISLSPLRLLAQVQAELLPDLRALRDDLIKMDALNTSPRIQKNIHRLNALIPRLETYQSKRERDFWNRVDQRYPHMIWLGEGKAGPNGDPVCEWGGKRTTPARVAWTLIRGETLASGRGGERLHRICGTPRCISPECHRKGSNLPGRVTGLHADKDGFPACAHGHTLRDRYGAPLKEWPAPRRTPYCPECYQARKIKESTSSRWNHLVRGTAAPAPIPSYETPEGIPMIVDVSVVEQEEKDEVLRHAHPERLGRGPSDEQMRELRELFGG
jgi:hypothetical protein